MSIEIHEALGGAVTWHYDEVAGTLYLKRKGARIVTSCGAPGDPACLILDYADAAHKDVTGLRLLFADEMPRAFWPTHPDRSALPEDLRTVLDGWIAENGWIAPDP